MSSSSSSEETVERLYATHDQWHVTALVDREGEVQERYAYAAYGQSIVLSPTFSVRTTGSLFDWETRYGAYRFDQESDLYQVRYRYLHPGLGRWLSRDPIEEEGGLNLYGYVGNNPEGAADPLGLDMMYSDGNRGGPIGDHALLAIQNPNSPTGWTVCSFGPAIGGWDNILPVLFGVPGNPVVRPGDPPKGIPVKTTPEQDAAALAAAEAIAAKKPNYIPLTYNCANFIADILAAGGVGVQLTDYIILFPTTITDYLQNYYTPFSLDPLPPVLPFSN